jgi:hypothetical protein
MVIYAKQKYVPCIDLSSKYVPQFEDKQCDTWEQMRNGLIGVHSKGSFWDGDPN